MRCPDLPERERMPPTQVPPTTVSNGQGGSLSDGGALDRKLWAIRRSVEQLVLLVLELEGLVKGHTGVCYGDRQL